MNDARILDSTGTRAAALAVLVLAAACAQPENRNEAAAPSEIANQALGVQLLLPADPWSLVANETERMVLDDGSGGTMTLHLGEPSEQTPNIVEAVRGRLAEFEAMEGGQSFGSRQFQAPIGLVYTARGAYPEAAGTGAAVGEMTGYTVHWDSTRFLLLTYTYPGDEDVQVRGQNLLALLESLAPLAEGDGGDEGDG